MRKSIILFLTLGLLLLSGCKKSDVNTPLDNSQEETKIENNNISIEKDNTLLQEEGDENEGDENTKDDDTEQTNLSSNDYLKEIINTSDYIIILNMSQTGAEGREINIIEELKGSIKNIESPNIEGIEPNIDYLVFLKDDIDGEITLTDEENSLVEIKSVKDDIVLKTKKFLNIESED